MNNPYRATPSIPARTRGFTLVELVTVIAIIAVIATIAMPDLSNLLVNQRLRGAATDLMSSLIVARSEAIKRNGLETGLGRERDREQRTDRQKESAGSERRCQFGARIHRLSTQRAADFHGNEQGAIQRRP